ncbi:hypothetical protein [Halalkalicoccus salilacus]|uniref:hypothetical protein n=1 Tax=Halalkalicoccus sp. GCM10025704 TaxID=3252662 RepID=UPI0036091B6C
MESELFDKIGSAYRNGVALARETEILRRLYEGNYSETPSEKARASRRPLRLTEREIEFLELKSGIEEGDVPDEWGYRAYELEERVAEKAQNLPVRLQLLFEDIELLHRYGYFDSDQWSEELRGLVDFGTLHSRSFAYGEPGQDEYRLAATGEVFGQLLDYLIPKDFVNHDSRANIAWGFIEGLWFSHNIDATARSRNRALDPLLDLIKERARKHLKTVGEAETEANEWYNEREERRRKINRYIQDIIEEYEIATEPSTSQLFATMIAPELFPADPYSEDYSVEEYVRAKAVLKEVIDQQLVEKSS